MKKTVYKIYFDGSCGNNSLGTAPMGIGVYISFKTTIPGITSTIIDSAGFSKNAGLGTNNIAEWKAFLEALDYAKILKGEQTNADFYFYGDSQLIVRQFSGLYQIKTPEFVEFKKAAIEAREILNRGYESFKGLIWIRRELNGEADKLSKEGRAKAIKELK